VRKTIGVAIFALTATVTPARSLELGANGALSSEYIFRGIPQSDGKAAVSGGLDLTQGGFYLGSWASTVDDGVADTSDGLEVDWYGGYRGEVGKLNYGIGGTWYTYTDDFDDDYLELNLSLGYSFLTLDAAIGEYDNFDGPTQDYEFYSLTAEYAGFFARAGLFENDFDGEYYEAGYGSTLSVGDTYLLDYSFSAIYSTDDLLGGEDDLNLVLSISRSFDIYAD